MRSEASPHIMPNEWRWLILVASLLTFAAFAPMLWLAIEGTGDTQFMGALHNFQDGATYLSKMEIGLRGNWFITFQHTPETHTGALIQVLYPLLGQLSRITGIPPIVMLHVARLGAALFMYVALYHLGAIIWTKVRTRRLFFGIAVLGAGWGWLFAGLMNNQDFPDLTIPEAFPFFSSLMNVHFPLTIALLALLVGMLIAAFRPGAEQNRDLDRNLPWASLMSLGLALLYPQALVPLGGAMVLHLVSAYVQTRRVDGRHTRWLLAVGLPAAPLFVYYALVVTYNPAMAEWNRQNITPRLPELQMLLGLGLPLILAIPGIYRAARRMELDGDRFFLFWLIAMVAALYLPTNIQRRFLVGLMIPIAYFATRAVEDVWLSFVSRRRRSSAFALLFALMPISLIFVTFAPVIIPVSGVMLERNYVAAFNYVREHSEPDNVVLAAPIVSTWVPGYARTRVVYGHEFETLNAAAKRQQVADWYAGTVNDCDELLDAYNVRYVIVGPQERRLANAEIPTCVANLQEIAAFGSVTVYAR